MQELSELPNMPHMTKKTKKKKKAKIPLLFVSYNYYTETNNGVGNFVFLNTKAPKTSEDYENLIDKVKSSSGFNNSCVMNWIVMK